MNNIDDSDAEVTKALTRNEIKDALERTVDHIQLSGILDLLAEIARDKAQHIEKTWQDRPLASKWTSASDRLEQMAGQMWKEAL